MPEFTIVCEGAAREVYGIIAASEEEAREKFEAGECGKPFVTECSGMEIVSVQEAD